MAVLNFPADPNIGDQYEFPPFIYEWDGEKWISVTVDGTASDVYVKKEGDTMTGSLTLGTSATAGQLKFGTDNQTFINAGPDMFIATNNGKIIFDGLTDPVVRVGSTDHRIYHEGFPPPASGGSAPYDGIRDGEIATAPTENAVFDALAGKSATGHTHTATEVGAISTAGGTAVGNITVNDSSGAAVSHATNGIHYYEGGILQWNAYYDVNDGSYNIIQYDAVTGGYVAQRFIIDITGSVIMNNPVSISAQGTSANALTRKDYVDGNFFNKSSLAVVIAQDWNTLMTSGHYDVQAGNSTTGTPNAPDSAVGLYGTLIVHNAWTFATQAFHPHSTDGSGKIAVREYYATTGWGPWKYCYDSVNKPTAAEIGAFSTSGGDVYGKVAARGTGNEYTGTAFQANGDGGGVLPGYAFHQPGFWEGTLEMNASNSFMLRHGGNSVYSDLHAGALYDYDQRVYSPNNQPNYTHVHSAIQGNYDVITAWHDVVGAHALMHCDNWDVGIGPGGAVAASQLWYTTCEGKTNGGQGSGTWKCLGYTQGRGDWASWDTTLWIRIA